MAADIRKDSSHASRFSRFIIAYILLYISHTMKIALFHDYFNSRGGGERVVQALAKKFRPDIYTYFFNRENTYPDIANYRIHESGSKWTKTPFARNLDMIRFFRNLDLKGRYDAVILHGYIAVWGSNNHPNVWYSIGTPKNIYSHELLTEPIHRRLQMSVWKRLVKQSNLEAVSKVDKMIVNSNLSRDRTWRMYGRESEVIYPPVDTKNFHSKKPEGFFFTASRLETNKRIHLIIEAFKKMPDKKLKIAGDGSVRKILERMASGYPNIEFLGRVGDEHLKELYATCNAFIFVPIMEDFGLVPVEAMASGKPVIAANEGGLKESMVDGKTGFLINANASEIMAAVEKCTDEYVAKVKNNCIKQAKKFDVSVFNMKMEKALKNAVRGK